MRARTIVLFGIGLALLSARPVAAADLALKAPAPACQWCGWYAGVHAGYASGKAEQSILGAAFPASPSPEGTFGGAQIGYNWIVRPNLLAGLEADISLGSISDRVTQLVLFPDYLESKSELEYFGTVRARVGHVDNGWLLYATGGLAWARSHLWNSSTVPFTDTLPYITEHRYRAGWTVGAGAEVFVAPQWTVKAEYLYADLGSKDYATNAPPFLPVTEDMTLHMFRLGLNYKFGADGSAALASAMPVKAVPRGAAGWTGWHVGVHAGYGIGHDDEQSVFDPVEKPKPQGAFGGLQAGYDWMLNETVLAGIETDVSIGSIRDKATTFSGPVSFETKSELEYFGTLRGRAGYLRDGWLFYATGGLAWGRSNLQGTFRGLPITLVIVDDHQFHIGWAAGAGLETFVAPQWTIKAEYLYADLGDDLYAPNAQLPPWSLGTRVHTIRLGANYKFGDPGVASRSSAMVLKAAPATAAGWAGAYLGAHAGWTHVRDRFDAIFYGGDSFSGDGFVGGLVAGYNWVITPQWVAGIEADAGASTARAQYFGGTVDAKLGWDTHIRARAGYAAGNWFVFAAGGLAVARFDQGVATYNGADGVHLGVTGGVGVDYAAGGNWILRAEYLRSHYLDEIYNYIPTGGGLIRTKFDVDTLRAAAIYKF